MGAIVNMGEFECPHCHQESVLLREGPRGGSKRLEGVEILGRLPMDPSVAAQADKGIVAALDLNTKMGQRYGELARKVAQLLDSRSAAT